MSTSKIDSESHVHSFLHRLIDDHQNILEAYKERFVNVSIAQIQDQASDVLDIIYTAENRTENRLREMISNLDNIFTLPYFSENEQIKDMAETLMLQRSNLALSIYYLSYEIYKNKILSTKQYTYECTAAINLINNLRTNSRNLINLTKSLMEMAISDENKNSFADFLSSSFFYLKSKIGKNIILIIANKQQYKVIGYDDLLDHTRKLGCYIYSFNTKQYVDLESCIEQYAHVICEANNIKLCLKFLDKTGIYLNFLYLLYKNRYDIVFDHQKQISDLKLKLEEAKNDIEIYTTKYLNLIDAEILGSKYKTHLSKESVEELILEIHDKFKYILNSILPIISIDKLVELILKFKNNIISSHKKKHASYNIIFMISFLKKHGIIKQHEAPMLASNPLRQKKIENFIYSILKAIFYSDRQELKSLSNVIQLMKLTFKYPYFRSEEENLNLNSILFDQSKLATSIYYAASIGLHDEAIAINVYDRWEWEIFNNTFKTAEPFIDSMYNSIISLKSRYTELLNNLETNRALIRKEKSNLTIGTILRSNINYKKRGQRAIIYAKNKLEYRFIGDALFTHRIFRYLSMQISFRLAFQKQYNWEETERIKKIQNIINHTVLISTKVKTCWESISIIRTLNQIIVPINSKNYTSLESKWLKSLNSISEYITKVKNIYHDAMMATITGQRKDINIDLIKTEHLKNEEEYKKLIKQINSLLNSKIIDLIIVHKQSVRT